MYTNASINDLNAALAATNEKFGQNIQFARIEQRGKKGLFRLRTVKTGGPGTALTARGRRTPSACWHAHGTFFEELLRIDPSAVITTAKSRIGAGGGNWQDYNVGSYYSPAYASTCCNCNH